MGEQLKLNNLDRDPGRENFDKSIKELQQKYLDAVAQHAEKSLEGSDSLGAIVAETRIQQIKQEIKSRGGEVPKNDGRGIEEIAT